MNITFPSNIDRNMSGIYQIRNLINNKTYIGSASCFGTRLNGHLCELRKNSHGNDYLQKAFNKYGEEKFIFEPLMSCDKNLLILFEQQFIDNLSPEYNICKIAGNSLGVIRTEKSKLRISLSKKGRKLNLSDEERQRRSDRVKNNKYGEGKIFSDEHKKKISIANIGNTNGLGYVHTDESKKKISAVGMGRVRKDYSGIVLESPDGELYSNITCLAKFCREQSISSSHIGDVINKKLLSSGGWRLYNANSIS